MHSKLFRGTPQFLRKPERLAHLEIPRVLALAQADIPLHSVLDVGTGSGVFAEAFGQSARQVVGIDISAEMLAVARELVPQAAFQQASMENLPFADKAFDLVFLGQVLHEADDMQRALAEAFRCARHRVAVLEWPPHRKEAMGPPLAHRLQPEAVLKAAQSLGCARCETFPLKHLVLYRFTF